MEMVIPWGKYSMREPLIAWRDQQPAESLPRACQGRRELQQAAGWHLCPRGPHR